MRIDSHLHFWNYNSIKDAWITDDMQIIQKDFLPKDFLPILHAHQMDGCIAVQADQTDAETKFLLDIATQNEYIKGVVGWIDLKANNLQEKLHHYAQHKKLKGFRHIVQAEPAGFLLNKQFIQGVSLLSDNDYTYDLLINSNQLNEAIQFVDALPNQKIIIDHCAKPQIRTKEIADWAVHLKAIAKAASVYCKLSGIITEADWRCWKDSDIYPYFDIIFDAFGIDRILFGSDWPVMLLAGNYTEWLRLVDTYLQNFSQQEHDAVMGKNANKFYHL